MKALKFPHQVRSGSVVVRVYRIKRRDGRQIYSVGWNAGHVRHLQQCGDLKTALDEAKIKAEQLAAGQMEAAQMSIAERDEYHAAKEAAGGAQLLEIVNEWNRARQLTGPDLMRACKQWSERHGGKVARKLTVAEAIKLFLAAKKGDGVKVKSSYERTLPRFAEALGSHPISSVGPEAIVAWLAEFSHPVSRNSHHARVVSLFRWCRKRSYLPLDVMTAAERVDRAREPRGIIGLVTPAQLRQAFALLTAKAPHYLPALTVASLCGLRRGEVHGQLWEHIELERKLLRVSDAKPNTPAHRFVPIPDAAIEWLLPHQQSTGPICGNLAMDRIRDICRTADLDLADNGLRHMFISARIAVTGNVATTALEAGNSPAICHKSYRELVRKEEAEAWFDVRPDGFGKVVPMPTSA